MVHIYIYDFSLLMRKNRKEYFCKEYIETVETSVPLHIYISLTSFILIDISNTIYSKYS